jgi:anti-anti-sigma factor
VLDVRPDLIVVDLHGCPFIDAAGISLLLELHRRAWVADGRVVLRSPTPQVLRVLRIARVTQVLRIEPERPHQDALHVTTDPPRS